MRSDTSSLCIWTEPSRLCLCEFLNGLLGRRGETMNPVFVVLFLMGVGVLLFAATFSPRQEVSEDRPLLARFLSRSAVNRERGSPDNQQRRELEASLREFMDWIEKENDAFLEEVDRIRGSVRDEIRSMQETLRRLEERVVFLEGAVRQREQGAASAARKWVTSPAAVPSAERMLFTGKYIQVYRMLQEGIPQEEIAKQTGIGLGEVQLVSELGKRGER
jgi:hypothetical protein